MALFTSSSESPCRSWNDEENKAIGQTVFTLLDSKKETKMCKQFCPGACTVKLFTAVIVAVF